jgi:hypothetical protein
MSDYTKTTNFAAKDSLPSGDPAKIIRGTEFNVEFDNIATASRSKADENNADLTGLTNVEDLTVTGTVTMTLGDSDLVTINGGTY